MNLETNEDVARGDRTAGESRTLTCRVADWLIRARWVLLVASLAATAAGVPYAMNLRFDASIDTLFSPGDPLVQTYKQSIEWFGGEELVVVAYRDPQLLTVEGLERNAEFAEKLRQAAPQAIRDLSSLAGSRRPSAPLNNKPLLEQIRDKPVEPDKLKEELLGSELHRKLVIGEDGETAAVLLWLEAQTQEKTETARRSVTVDALKQVVASHPLRPHIAGSPVLVTQAVEYLDQDGNTFLIWTTGMLVVVLGVLFRSLRWVVLPLAVVHITLVWTKAILVLAEAQLTMISSILTAMVTVIGIATVIHATVKFREHRLAGLAPVDALRLTLVHIGPACFWTSATTAAGFGALMICEIAPIRSFGLMMCLGSMLVWVVPAFILPGLVLLPGLGGDPAAAPGEELLGRRLEAVLDRVKRHPKTVWAVVLVIVAGLLVGIPRLEIETDFSRNFRRSSPIVTASQFIEDNLCGTGQLEVSFDVPEKLDVQTVDRLRDLERQLREIPRVSKVLGLVDVLDFAGKTPSPFLSPQAVLELKIKTLQDNAPGVLTGFWNREASRMRVLLRAPERATSAEKSAIIESATEVSRRVLEQDAHVTGFFLLLTHLVNSLLYDQRNTFALAATLCLVMLIVAFRDWRLGLIAMLPNAFPILMVVGAMGWFGLPVNMATAMLSSVSIGMAVDSSIHYIYHFRRERQAGLDFDAALQSAHQTVGRALSFANLAIVVGFSALTLSNFIPTIHFGILVSIALLGGLAGNLFILPLMMRALPGLRGTSA